MTTNWYGFKASTCSHMRCESWNFPCKHNNFENSTYGCKYIGSWVIRFRRVASLAGHCQEELYGRGCVRNRKKCSRDRTQEITVVLKQYINCHTVVLVEEQIFTVTCSIGIDNNSNTDTNFCLKIHRNIAYVHTPYGPYFPTPGG